MLKTADNLQPLAPPIAKPVELRSFGDAKALRANLFGSVLNAVQNTKPVANNRYTLHISDAKYAGPEEISKAQWKQALLSQGSLTRKLVGKVHLTDNLTQQPVAVRTMTLANVPYITDHNTIVNNGTEYPFSHQLRQDAGVYSRRKQNGELESHVNVIPGQGWSHRVFMTPETGVFHMRIGQANLPLMPVLKALGATDGQLREHWGNELYSANATKDSTKTLTKLHEKLVRPPLPGAPVVEQSQAIANSLRAMKVSPEVTRRTLGQPFENIDLPLYLATTKKLIAINKGEAEPDDRDSPAFQTLHGPEDLLAERVAKDTHNLRNILWKSTAKGHLDHLSPGIFDKALKTGLLGSGLSNPLEQINPLEILDQATRVTKLGAGGISDADAVPAESRNVGVGQHGFIDFLRTPESQSSGVDLRLAHAARKGSDGRIYAPVRDIQTGRTNYMSPQQLADSVVTFPGELESGEPYINAVKDGQQQLVHRSEARYTIPHGEDPFNALSNLIPLKSMLAGQRGVMGSRFLAQALPLEDAEAPLVRTASPNHQNKSFEEVLGHHAGAVRAQKPGRVIAVAPDKITVQHADGTLDSQELHQNLPFNRKTPFHQEPVVQVGQQVEPGTLLAKSNFTDDKGHIAVGKNARWAFLPFRGLNYEDAIVVSDSMAKRLTSQHAYQHDKEWDDTHKRGLNNFVSLFPRKYNRAQLANFDENGVIKPGTKVQPGDPLVLAARASESLYGQVHRGHKAPYVDESITWEHNNPGIVTDAVDGKKTSNVVVRSNHAMKIGDKLSARYGDKGTVHVIPDDQMPTDKDGLPYEVLTNPLGLISRGNPSQIVEAALGRVAAKTGQPYSVRDWEPNANHVEFAKQELAKHGMNLKEDVIDPETGRKIANVYVGNRWFMKLHHESESKGQGRGIGNYSAEGIPSKGGVEGAKRVGMLNLGALLSHGAGRVISDVKLIKGQANPEYWSQVASGYNPPTPSTPFVYRKFLAHLQGAGINPVRQGTQTHVMALTDADVDKLAGDRELQNTDTVDWSKGQKPVRGGLFDEAIFGDKDEEQRWGKITLHEPMPSPVMEEPLRKTLGLTEQKFRDILAGHAPLNGKTGPAALHDALSNIDLPKAIEQARTDIAGTKKGVRDAAVKRLGYLKSAERIGVHPRDWMLSKMPVLPPAFRPVTTLGATGMPLVSDSNYLYHELHTANKNLKALSSQVDDVGDERLAVYDAMKAVTGLGDPTHVKNQERGVKGLLQQIFGSTAKLGMVQRKLLGTPTDLVGRATIMPNPDLDMDSVGLPEKHAWSVYKPFVIGNLVRSGMPRLAAANAVDKQTPQAREALLQELGKRPVIIDRAPALHRYSMMASWPRLVKGEALQISPTIVKGLGADFDGNCCVASTYINLGVDWKQLAGSSLEYCAKLALLVGSTAKVGSSYVTLQIGKLPTTAEICESKNGQTIYKLPTGLYVLTYDNKQAIGSCYSAITHFTVEDSHNCVQVTTQTGHTVGVSNNESLCTYSFSNGGLRKTFTEDAVGRLAPCVRTDWLDNHVNVVPVPTSLVKDLKAESENISGNRCRCMLPRKAASRLALDFIEEGLTNPLFDDWWRIVVDKTIYWDEIVSVEPLPSQPVFDLAVPETAVFAVNNGLVIWDTMNYAVPASNEAAEEAAAKMLPSKNLFSISRLNAAQYVPQQEYLGGLHTGSTERNNSQPMVFDSVKAMRAAYYRGEIGAGQPVEIRD